MVFPPTENVCIFVVVSRQIEEELQLSVDRWNRQDLLVLVVRSLRSLLKKCVHRIQRARRWSRSLRFLWLVASFSDVFVVLLRGPVSSDQGFASRIVQWRVEGLKNESLVFGMQEMRDGEDVVGGAALRKSHFDLFLQEPSVLDKRVEKSGFRGSAGFKFEHEFSFQLVAFLKVD